MARTMIRDGGGGRRRAYAKVMSSAFCLLLISALMVGCSLDSPSSPNAPGDLTGQTTNQSFTFSGTIGVTKVSGTIIADDATTVTIIATVRDANGNPVPNLTNITFSADLGGFVIGVDGQGNNLTSSVASSTTFNGQASVDFQSAGGTTGTARITASLGNVSGSTTVKIEPAPLSGTIELTFGSTAGAGGVTLSGTATVASPLETAIALQALDSEGSPIVGADVSFRIVEDTTGDNTSNPYAEFVASRHTTTGASGDAVNILRAYGPGVVVVVAELYDPNGGKLVGTSNRIFLTTEQQVLVSQAFAGGGTAVAVTAPATVGITATVTNIDLDPQEGLTVRFTISEDGTDAGASLSAALAVTDGNGQATTALTVPDNASGAGASVSVLVEVIDATGTTVATGNVIVATATP